MKKLIIVANDTQACGKTTLALVIAEFLERRKIKHALALTSIEQELPVETDLLDLSEEIQAHEVVDRIDKNRILILDVNTEDAADFAAFFKQSDLDDVLDDIDTGLTVVVPVCDDAEVLRNACSVAESFHGIADFLAVWSPLLADVPENWETSKARRALGLLGAVELQAPTVPAAVLDQLDALELDLPLALTQRSLLNRFLRLQLLAWENEFAERLGAVTDLIVPQRDAAADLRTDSVYGQILAF
ncbi:MAG: hypothetical protein KA004_17115 [Verrucomicrobiales bacterium]|nr:hypothetical protein [Verrucomicrobiales bacterium]